jgi:hypothetical protein
MITQDELDELIATTPSDEPLFASIEEMCDALGFDDATRAQIKLDSELTRPPEPGDTLQ